MSSLSKLRKITAALLLAGILSGYLVSCSDADSSGDSGKTDTVGTSDTNTETEAADVYKYPIEKYNGHNFTILNGVDVWDFNVDVNKTELNGESLNDAMYQRNLSVKEQLGIDISQESYDMDTLPGIAQASIMSGDDAYDVTYLPMYLISGMVTDKSFLNLNEISTLHLDEVWWDKALNESASIGDKMYFAAGDFHIMPYDGTWCMFFNEEILNDYGLEMPYQLVRDGKWTLDKMYEYCSQIANLNGDASYTWNKDNHAIYGMSSFDGVAPKFMFAADAPYISKDEDGIPYFSAANNEHFINAAEKIAKFMGEAGTYYQGYTTDDKDPGNGGYVYVFKAQRAAFLGGELKIAQVLRDMDQSFGIVPFPKYDETQQNYKTTMLHQLLVMTIPVTSSNPARTGMIMDLLSYESSKTVIPIYYDVNISYKGLRNEESIEMLQIVKSTRECDMGVSFQWASGLDSTLRTTLAAGKTDIASKISSNEKVINKAIDKMLSAFLD